MYKVTSMQGSICKVVLECASEERLSNIIEYVLLHASNLQESRGWAMNRKTLLIAKQISGLLFNRSIKCRIMHCIRAKLRQFGAHQNGSWEKITNVFSLWQQQKGTIWLLLHLNAQKVIKFSQLFGGEYTTSWWWL